MSEETPLPATAPEPSPPVTAPTTIEALHDLKAREGIQIATELALRQLLHVLDPHPNDHALTYDEILGRLETVILRARQAQSPPLPGE